jgi:hypothetical protein
MKNAKSLAKVAGMLVGMVAGLLGLGCTVVTPASPDGGTKIVPVPIRPDALPPPKPLEASLLFVVNLHRSSANLSAQYASIMLGLAGYLQSVGLQIDNLGVISTYADQFGPRLLLGRQAGAPPPGSQSLAAALAVASASGAVDYTTLLPFIAGSLGNISDGDLPVALNLLASSGSFDGDGETSEAKNLIAFGGAADVQALPPELGGIDRSAFFDRPRDLFIVVYLQPLPRRCAIGTDACQIDGRAPADLLEQTDADGGLTWLKFAGGSIRPEQVVHLAIATSEGESLDAFRARCGAVPGFPRNLFDVIAPSPNGYFTPLMASIDAAHAGTGHSGDFCGLIGSSPDDAIKALGTGVAAVAGTHTP